MKWIVYRTIMRNNLKDWDIICETNQENIADFAADLATKSIGKGLEVIVLYDGRLKKLIQGVM